ncbi:TetR/AcrR family transcriptional regulator [Pseudonocardia eucalypti]|uniref:TetR/AcrR family transcriptional regulator n=1 Tax=Pseudonocardia eucalypti TaxID=648755 RepID=A0ABP9RFG5_9PSEU|nr:AcrR family transcriptional regulator [Pseudonocardia eucalypti]
MPATRVDGRSLRYRHRRAELLEALTDYLVDEGLREFSLRRAAVSLGVTHATLLRHFRSKDDLLAEVIDNLRVSLLARLEADPELRSARSTRRFMLSAWRLLDNPRGRREFLLLFAAIGEVSPRAVVSETFAKAAVQDWLGPIERSLVRDGWPEEQAPVMATAALSLIRGLQLDEVVTGDRERSYRAFTLAVDRLLDDRARS